MKIEGIKFRSPTFDSSGYAKASRDYIFCLLNSGIPVTLDPVSFDMDRPELDEKGRVLHSLIGLNIPYNVNLMQLTPEHFPIFREEGKFNVGVTIWEATKIPDEWVRAINESVDLLIVPCEWNRKTFIDCGVKVPVEIVHYAFDKSEFEDEEKAKIQGVDEKDFVFYSIFQFTERKNPIGLIRSYYYAFQDVKDVALVLKTYRTDSSYQEVESVINICKQIRDDFNVEESHMPKVLVIPNILSEKEIVRLHNRGDCYVSAARSEGWGLGLFHSMAKGKPVISPGGTGNMQFMREDNSYLTGYTWCSVFGMPFIPWYNGTQLWLEPNQLDLSYAMRYVYDNQDEAKAKGEVAKEFINDNFNFEVVGKDLISKISKHIC